MVRKAVPADKCPQRKLKKKLVWIFTDKFFGPSPTTFKTRMLQEKVIFLRAFEKWRLNFVGKSFFLTGIVSSCN